MPGRCDARRLALLSESLPGQELTLKKSLPRRNAICMNKCVPDQLTAASSCWPGLQEFIFEKGRFCLEQVADVLCGWHSHWSTSRDALMLKPTPRPEDRSPPRQSALHSLDSGRRCTKGHAALGSECTDGPSTYLGRAQKPRPPP